MKLRINCNLPFELGFQSFSNFRSAKIMLRSLVILLFLPPFLSAQISAPPFQHLSVDDGLPQNSITALAQGPDGFLWIGTQDGLARYDGYDFKIYRSEEGNSNSLSHNFIWDIYFDDEGNLWATTLGNGLSRLDTRRDHVSQWLQGKGDSGLYHWNTFSTLKMKNTLWVGTNESLDKINLETGERISYFPGKEAGETEPAILVRTLALSVDSTEIWMNSKKGLARLHIESDSLEYFDQSPFGTASNLLNIHKIETDDQGLLITTGRKIISINWKDKEEKIIFDADSLGLAKNLNFHGFYRGIGRFNYIYSGGGIFRIEKSTGRILHLVHDPDNPTSLSHNYVIDLCETSDGVLWAGTRNGLNAVRTKTEDFLRFGKTNQKEYSLSSVAVRGLLYNKKDELWAGSDLGINIINLETGIIRPLKEQLINPETVKSEYILSLIKDGNGSVWSGIRGGGLLRLNRAENNQYRAYSDPLNNTSIQFILDEDSILWLGSSGSGLLKYHKEKGLVKSYPHTGDDKGPSHTFVFTIYRDPNNIIWLGTPTGGINIFDRKTESFSTIRTSRNSNNGLSGNTILCFFEDSRKRLWIGTTSGLSLLKTSLSPDLIEKINANRDHLKFEHFGRKEGFPNEVIYGIREDKIGNLWISTNDGLVKFNGERVVDVFTLEDGCQVDEYNQNAALSLPDGRMVFGGVSGLHLFNPERLGKFYYQPKCVLTDIQVNHNKLDSKGIESLPYGLKSLELDYTDDVIDLSFAGLSYVNSSRNTYAYRLVGFDSDWNHTTSDKRFVTYTNLDPGNYIFEIKSANCDGVWSNQIAQLPISVSYPPWQKWYAFLAYAIVLSALVYLLVQWRTEKARRAERLKLRVQEARLDEREKFRKEAARDFHDEAGNKITRINLLVELASSRAGDDYSLKGYFEKIAQNTAQLSSGMRDFNWSLDPEKDSLKDLCMRISEFGESMYEGADQSFSSKIEINNPGLIALGMALRRDLLMIFKEAINNAAKHADSPKAEFRVYSAGKDLVMELKDFGKGIEDEPSSAGYGLKNMKSRAEAHGGRVDISANKVDGTLVQFKINLTHLG
jgi:ligand-binding sensor domain-containing protein/signal transduction histidine kinase